MFGARILSQLRQLARCFQLELLLQLGISRIRRVQQHGHGLRLPLVCPIVVHCRAHHAENLRVLAMNRIHFRCRRRRIVLPQQLHQLIAQLQSAHRIDGESNLPRERRLLHLRQSMSAGSRGNGVQHIEGLGLRDR